MAMNLDTFCEKLGLASAEQIGEQTFVTNDGKSLSVRYENGTWEVASEAINVKSSSLPQAFGIHDSDYGKSFYDIPPSVVPLPGGALIKAGASLPLGY
jgi:hypothetical protein